jgi:uncharacterized membrane protein YcaP (DUF421 family)
VDVVARAAVIFVLLWFVTRVVGKRTLGEMTAFELVLLIVTGDLIQQGVTQEDYSLTGAALAVGTFALLIVGLSWLGYRFPRLRTPIEGPPVVVVRDGKLLTEVLELERLPDSEVLEAARQNGVEDLADVRLGVLEPDGKFSFFTTDPQRRS